jgi:hypothetical protein
MQRHATVIASSSRMADLDHLLCAANVCQVVTDEDVKTLEDIKKRMGMNRIRLAKKAAKQVCSKQCLALAASAQIFVAD